ncbi:hypothetical protein [Halobacterium wangiae]|uniref:hypothetical protein n=1 Tax=Halobacterium wangiae TaxID=2902623 RepID=UPI001E2A3D42|nr:hypothetical protein [Halobacterium wangiae]
MVWVIDNVVSLAENFATAAGVDPLSTVLILVGVLLILASSAVFGGLATAGLLEGFVPDTAFERQRRERDRT